MPPYSAPPEDGHSMFFPKVGIYLRLHTASKLRTTLCMRSMQKTSKKRELITLDVKLDLEDLVNMLDDFIWIKFRSNGRFS
jgi:hypothetical protein